MVRDPNPSTGRRVESTIHKDVLTGSVSSSGFIPCVLHEGGTDWCTPVRRTKSWRTGPVGPGRFPTGLRKTLIR